MVTKKELLANLRNYTPEEIADAIRVGEVTMYELGKYAGGQFTPLLKRKVKTLLAQPEAQPQPESPQTSVPKQVMPQSEMNMQHQASAPQYHTPVQDYGVPYSNNTLRQDTQPLSFEPNKLSDPPCLPLGHPIFDTTGHSYQLALLARSNGRTYPTIHREAVARIRARTTSELLQR